MNQLLSEASHVQTEEPHVSKNRNQTIQTAIFAQEVQAQNQNSIPPKTVTVFESTTEIPTKAPVKVHCARSG